MDYIKDSYGRFVGSVTKNGSTSVVRDFKSNNIVATYDSKSNTTREFKSGRTSKGDSSVGYLRK